MDTLLPELYPNIVIHLRWSDIKNLSETCKRFAAFMSIAKKVLMFRPKADISFEVFKKHIAGMRKLSLKGLLNFDEKWAAEIMNVEEIEFECMAITSSNIDLLRNIESICFKNCKYIRENASSQLINVKKLNIHDHNTSFETLQISENLRELSVDSVQIFELPNISCMGNLTVLHIDGVIINNLSFFKEMPNLLELRTKYSYLPDDVFKYLGGLRRLELEYCTGTTSAAFRYMNELINICVVSCRSLTEEFLKYVGYAYKIRLFGMKLSAVGIKYLYKVPIISLFSCNIDMKDLLLLEKTEVLMLDDNATDFDILYNMKSSLRHLVLRGNFLFKLTNENIYELADRDISIHLNDKEWEELVCK